MKHGISIAFSLVLLLVMVGGCTQQTTTVTQGQDQVAAYSHQNLSPSESKDLLEKRSGDSNFVLVDIRTPEEFASGHLEGALNVDYYAPDFAEQMSSMDTTKTYLIYCRSGNRSGNALRVLASKGFTDIYDISGGIVAFDASCRNSSNSFCMLVTP